MGKMKSTITINSMSFEDDNDEEHVMHSKTDNIKIMINDEAGEFIKNFLIYLKTETIIT